MANEIHKVLLVAYLDDSRPAAYKITTHLKEYGYGVDICHTPPTFDENDEKEIGTEFQADLYFSKVTDLGIYNGVIFLDDGGDPVVSKVLAKRADAEEKAVGGYAFGVEVLHLSGLLKDKFVPANIPKEWAKGGKLVNSPSVRCDNVVSSAGNCAAGFSMLMIDALGGENKRMVESDSPDAVPLAEASLVVAPVEKWADYWTLSEKLSQKNTTLILADWSDIDLSSKTVTRFVAVGPHLEEKVAFIDIPVFIPKNVWLRQSFDNAADAVASLEAIGCVNANSSEAIKLACDKPALAKILGLDVAVFDQTTLDGATKTLIASGTRWVKSASRNIMIQGHGSSALVSKQFGANTTHQVVDEKSLSKMLEDHNESFIVKNDAGSISLGGRPFNLRFQMQKGMDWTCSAEHARSGNVSWPAAEFMQAACPSNASERLAAAKAKAFSACQAFEGALQNPESLIELEISIGFNGDDPIVSDIEAIPTSGSTREFSKYAQALGMDKPAPEMQDNSHAAPVMEAKPDEQQWYKMIERELGCQGIWMQRDGRYAVSDAEGIDVKTAPELVTQLKGDIKYFLEQFKENDQSDNLKARMYSRLVRNSVLKLRLVKKFDAMNSNQRSASSQAIQKTAEYNYDKTIPGPYSNIQEPERVLPWIDDDEPPGDGSNIDADTIRRLDRYHPSSKDGISSEFDLWHSNDPTLWSDVEKGEGNYPMRAPLMRG